MVNVCGPAFAYCVDALVNDAYGELLYPPEATSVGGIVDFVWWWKVWKPFWSFEADRGRLMEIFAGISAVGSPVITPAGGGGN